MKLFTKEYPEKKNAQEKIRQMVSSGKIDETTALEMFRIINDVAAAAYNIGIEDHYEDHYNEGFADGRKEGYSIGVAAGKTPAPSVPAFMLRHTI